ncbi:hypothetical protein SAMN04488078_11405 [Antarctobacter heliothermus]|uniref:Uncharacterized protein n=1 Tax=Antarctobacter heliothermus TaxID=74033 RepID=A0A239MD15_9RHOB|nr:hypothetical protein SAMN04488078_11405 [Antarctobacter heliothermus]
MDTISRGFRSSERRQRTDTKNTHQARAVLAAGMNVAAVVDSLEGTLFGFPIIDGDEHDLRFLDPSPCVVGLKAKGSLRSSETKEMVYDTNQYFTVPDAA